MMPLSMSPGGRAQLDQMVAQAKDDLGVIVAEVRVKLATTDEADFVVRLIQQLLADPALSKNAILAVALVELARRPA